MPSGLRGLFPGYYQPTRDELESLWKDGLFVLDTNVLLDIYRYPERTRKDTINVLSRIAHQLWIPYHVGLEYHEQIDNVISEQIERYDEVIETVRKIQNHAEGQLGNLGLVKRHSSIDPTKFITALKTLTNSFQQEIAALRDAHSHNYNDTELRDSIESLLENRIGSAPPSQSHIDAINSEGTERYQNQLPPGFEDGKKTGSVRHNNIVYDRKFGDLVIWKQIIEHVKTGNYHSVVFVTNDTKEDWWHIVNKIRVGPRRELAEEFYLETGAKIFHIYDTAQLIQHSNNFLATRVEDESIDRVREISNPATRKGVPHLEKADVINAINAFDLIRGEGGWWADFPSERHARHRYAIMHEGNLYPVKQIISMASNLPTSRFSGGTMANRRIRDLGFLVVEIDSVLADDELLDDQLDEPNGLQSNDLDPTP